MIKILLKNKEWLFSGIGVALLTVVLGFFFSTSDQNSVQSQSGNNNYQASGDLVITYFGLSKEEFKQHIQDKEARTPSAAEQQSFKHDHTLGQLLSYGFSIISDQREKCIVYGEQGACEVEAFVFGEANIDRTAYTCTKLNYASYEGSCIDGKVNGVALIRAKGRAKLTPAAFLAYFYQGKMVFPALHTYLEGTLNFGIREMESSYGCVYYGKWDKSHKRDKCQLISEVFGENIMSPENAAAIRSGDFNINEVRTHLANWVSLRDRPPETTKSVMPHPLR